MTFLSKFREARHRALVLAALILTLVACNSSDLLDSTNIEPPAGDGESLPNSETPSFATAYAGGIPFGATALPTDQFGSRYNGALRNIHPSELLSHLSQIKSRGGKVALMFAGPEWLYKTDGGRFSLSKWKARVDRFKYTNFSSYVKDGTIIAHYLIDEPNDPNNWGGVPISPSTLEEMARYSKSRWPGMATLVRTYPEYLTKKSGGYQYLDAAWAQYVIFRWPNVQDFINSNVSKAKLKGLALVVGLNVIKGGSSSGTSMTPEQIRKYGSALLSSSYPCAFLSWQYRDTYFSKTAVKDAMSYLRSKATGRSFKTCRGS